MTEANALIPALYGAESPLAARSLLAQLDREGLKVLAKEFGGYARINEDVTDDTLRESILAGLTDKRAAVPDLVELGATVVDEEDGSEVQITPELIGAARAALDRLAQAEHSVARGLADICLAISEFKGARGYLAFGFRSFKAYCDAGRLKVFGQTRSRPWAYEKIRIAEALSPELITSLRSGLPYKQLLKLARAVTSGGMELALAELGDGTEVTWRGADGQEHMLRLPETPEDLERWREFIGAMGQHTTAARLEADDARDALMREKSERAEEADELRAAIAEREEEIARLQGMGEEEIAKLLRKEAGELTPEDVGRLKVSLGRMQEEQRQARADLAERERRLEEISGELDRRSASAAEIAQASNVRTALERTRAAWAQTITEMQPLLAVREDLPPRARDLLEGALREIQDEVHNLLADTVGMEG